MLRSKLQGLSTILIPFLYLATQTALAADAPGGDAKPADNTTHTSQTPADNTAHTSQTPADQQPEHSAKKGKKSHETPTGPSAFEKLVASKLILSSGFGLIRAYKGGDLRANGFADVKASYLTPLDLFLGKKIYASFLYFPFQIAPDATVQGSDQGYTAIVETFAVGVDLDLSFAKKFDFLVSGALGVLRTNFTELIPVTETQPPLNRIGGLVILGAECLFKPFKKFKVGPRVNFGGGSLTFVSLAINSSFYF